LGLGDFDRAKFNYLRLYALDKPLANKLLDAMRTWLETRADTGVANLASARDWMRARTP
jgi:hypothetical protein